MGNYVLIAKKGKYSKIREHFDIPATKETSRLAKIGKHVIPMQRRANELTKQGYKVTYEELPYGELNDEEIDLLDEFDISDTAPCYYICEDMLKDVISKYQEAKKELPEGGLLTFLEVLAKEEVEFKIIF